MLLAHQLTELFKNDFRNRNLPFASECKGTLMRLTHQNQKHHSGFLQCVHREGGGGVKDSWLLILDLNEAATRCCFLTVFLRVSFKYLTDVCELPTLTGHDLRGLMAPASAQGY